jgi:hypothetical protein
MAEHGKGSCEKFVDENIRFTKNFNEYLQRNGGVEKIQKLRRLEHLF